MDLRFQRTGSATMYVFNELVPPPCKCLSLVVLPTAFPCGHRCTVGVDRDPPMCLDAQGGIKAKRQPFCGWCCFMCLGYGRRDVLWCTFCQMLELRILIFCFLKLLCLFYFCVFFLYFPFLPLFMVFVSVFLLCVFCLGCSFITC